MSKSRNSDHLGFVRAVLTDVVDYYPDYRLDMERDLSRLMSHSRMVGDRVFLIDLPALGKLLERALEVSALSRSNLALSAGFNSRTTVPRLFQGLWLRIFERDGCLKLDVDTNALFFLRTLLQGQKKFKKRCEPSVTYKAIQEFYDIDEALPSGSSIWDHDGSDLRHIAHASVSDGRMDSAQDLFLVPNRGNLGGLHLMLDIGQQVADRVASGFGEYQPDLYAFKHGPGATAEYQRGRGFKYLFPRWSPRLQHVFPAVRFGLANPNVYGRGFASSDDDLPYPVEEVESRLIAVPKTQKAPRLIAAEPTANQWCQQNVKDFLDKAIQASPLRWSIDFRNQGLSQEGARLGSISGDYATVDLSSASDRVSCWLVERLFRRNHSLLAAFVATRTRYITNNIDKKSPKLHKLRKFSSMGSALTFPVQSIVFYILCVTAGLATEGAPVSAWKRFGKRVRVYGDDLIVPRTWVPRVMELFTELHLKVNQDKTFWNGKFRESCGMDAYDGDDVTPAYFLQFPNEAELGSIVSTVQVSNNFLTKGLWKTSQWIARLVPRKWRQFIPVVPIGSGTFGLYSYSGYDQSSTLQRWNHDYQRYEIRSLGVFTQAGENKHEGPANLLQFFTEDPGESGRRLLCRGLNDLGGRPLSQGDLRRRTLDPSEQAPWTIRSKRIVLPVTLTSDWESGQFGRATQTVRKTWVPLDAVVPNAFDNAEWNKAVSTVM
ncbi:TPA_asm: RNA-directed RNA polymerase [ssRNA phage SRR5466338_5]|uniref:RNA-directed RNA polymerase n=1 Tax=ssRNA phage SRR5466338_5 TaxID=2786394 RepID=A0A8S5L582_9VIRU|nr:RNA-directed RNA polymerase [ssRNA phage SRR5466338_5]DAD52370.1 TPA_asm: RNA-directed RNA polymerase [ssRNA phage SRR5466338_5]